MGRRRRSSQHRRQQVAVPSRARAHADKNYAKKEGRHCDRPNGCVSAPRPAVTAVGRGAPFCGAQCEPFWTIRPQIFAIGKSAEPFRRLWITAADWENIDQPASVAYAGIPPRSVPRAGEAQQRASQLVRKCDQQPTPWHAYYLFWKIHSGNVSSLAAPFNSSSAAARRVCSFTMALSLPARRSPTVV